MHAEFIETAKKLACQGAIDPTATDLRRAVSTAYYAMFHFLSEACASAFLGTENQDLERAWEHTYRTLQHGNVCSKCAYAKSASNGFPDEIREFAVFFIDLYDKRCAADYSPYSEEFGQVEVDLILQGLESHIEKFQACHDRDKKAFCVLVALKDNRRRRGS